MKFRFCYFKEMKFRFCYFKEMKFCFQEAGG